MKIYIKSYINNICLYSIIYNIYYIFSGDHNFTSIHLTLMTRQPRAETRRGRCVVSFCIYNNISRCPGIEGWNNRYHSNNNKTKKTQYLGRYIKSVPRKLNGRKTLTYKIETERIIIIHNMVG